MEYAVIIWLSYQNILFDVKACQYQHFFPYCQSMRSIIVKFLFIVCRRLCVIIYKNAVWKLAIWLTRATNEKCDENMKIFGKKLNNHCMSHQRLLINSDFEWKVNYDCPNQLSLSIFINSLTMSVMGYEQKAN